VRWNNLKDQKKKKSKNNVLMYFRNKKTLKLIMNIAVWYKIMTKVRLDLYNLHDKIVLTDEKRIDQNVVSYLLMELCSQKCSQWLSNIDDQRGFIESLKKLISRKIHIPK
jgi:hypothetical protein